MPALATVAAFGFADFNPPSLLTVYRRIGCCTCQFYRNEQNPPTTADAKRIVEDAGMRIDSVHGVFGPDYDPSSPVDAVRQQAVETYRREGELAVELGGPMVVVHPGPSAEYETHVYPRSDDERIKPLRRTMADLARIGEQLGVIYLIENIPNDCHMGGEAPRLGAMIRELDHPNVRMCFDTGHANMTGDAVRDFDACADVIGYVHVHDNHGKLDNHRMPGDGTIDWAALGPRIAQLPDGASAMLELFFSEQEMIEAEREGFGERVCAWLSV